MSRSPKRYRGVVLTKQGIERLESEIATAQDKEKYGKRFTQAELSERAKLSIKTIKKIRDRTSPVDEVSVRTLFEAFGLALETADYGLPELPPQLTDRKPTPKEKRSTKIDWGEKPDTTIFFGRTEDLAILDQWVMTDQCRLVTLLGMGGIGKTSLAAKLADQIYEQFDYVIWRSLREAPPLDEILVRLIQFLSDQQETEINLPTRLGERIIRLLHYLREYRCLLVLDNLESILQAGKTGQFRNGYEEYGEFIHRIGEAEHQSCLLLTSRECPRELAPMAGDHLPIRLWPVGGVDYEAGQEILKAKGLILEAPDNQGQELIRRYSGNPQALHLVATAIQREYLGDVDDFLEEEGATGKDISSLLDQHLKRLAPLEYSILFWLMINREPVGLGELMEDLLPPATKQDVRSALRGLGDRYLIETVGKQFTLQNVIMEFATDRFVEQVSRELNTQQFDLFHTHALMKATAKDYVRENQVRLILKPISSRIKKLKHQIIESLNVVQQHPDWVYGYAPGNLLNLLCQTNMEVYGADFSKLTLRQVHLKGMQLRNLSLVDTLIINFTLTETFNQICSVAFHPGGEVIAAGDNHGKIQLWSVTNQQQIATLSGHENLVQSITFSSDKKLLITSSEDATVRIWDIQKYQCIHTLTGYTKPVSSVAVSPNGQLLATGSEDATVRIWDIQKYQYICTFTGHEKWISSVAFSPDGKWLASSSGDATIRLWDIDTHQCLQIFTGHTDWVTSVAFSPNGCWIASGSIDTTVRLWNIHQLQCIRVLKGHQNFVFDVTFSPNGEWLASSSSDTTIRLWNVHCFECLQTFTGHTSSIESIAFSPDNKWLVSGSEDATVRLWDMHQRQCIRTLNGYTIGVNSVTFDSKGYFLITGGDDTKIRIWDILKRRCLKNFSGHTHRVFSVTLSPDGTLLATTSEDNTIRLWDIRKQQCLQVFSGHTNMVVTATFSPNGSWLASGSFDNTVRIWDVQKRQNLHTFTAHANGVKSVAFSPDGNWLVSGGGDVSLRIWDTHTYRCIHTFTDHNNTDWISSVAISPDGEWLATGDEGNTIRLWNIQQCRCLHTFTGHTNMVCSIAFNSEGQLLVSGSGDGTIRVWDVQKQNCLKILEGHNSWVNSVKFSPDGQTITSSSVDGSIRLWNVQTGCCVSILQVPRPYEETNITGVQGLTEAQRTSMIALGALDYSCESLVNK